MRRLIVVVLIVGLSGVGCQSDTARVGGRVINPNGDSELAVLMRDMFEDGMRTKEQLLNGEMPEIRSNYKHIFEADATEPEKVASTDYLLYGKAYEASVHSLMEADNSSRGEAYQTMVGACMNCHQAMCPGPMVKIRKMYLTDNQLQAMSAK